MPTKNIPSLKNTSAKNLASEGVSIVVPVYNIENYISKCIESLMKQSYKNIEIILVDDGSLDGSLSVCNAYMKKDNRIKVIKKNNGGLSDARNAGLLASKFDYICFVDGDDYVEMDYVKRLIETAVLHNADIVGCAFTWVYESGERTESQGVGVDSSYSAEEALEDIFRRGNGLLNVVSWNKIYKRSLFTDNEITFPFGRTHEDNFTTYKLIGLSNKIIFIGVPLYNYVQREGSIMALPFSRKRLHVIDAFDEAVDWTMLRYPKLEGLVRAYRIEISVGVLSYVAGWRDKDAKSVYDATRERVLGYLNNDLNTSVRDKLSRRMLIDAAIIKFSGQSYKAYRTLIEKAKK